jgi:hypothetical protein
MSNPTSGDASATNIASFSKRVRWLSKIPWVKTNVQQNIREHTNHDHDTDNQQANSGFTGESRLCHVCDRLDLSAQAFVVKDGDDEHDRTRGMRYLGLLSRIRGKTHCPFCRLVLAIADRPPDQRAPSHIATEDPTVYARWVIDGQDDLGQDSKHPREHLYQPRTRRLLIYSEPQTFKDGYIMPLGEDAPFSSFFGRVVPSGQLDASRVKGWLKSCEQHHGLECEDSLVHPQLRRESPSVVFRAIDVEQMCIAEPPADSRYVALSYLWGRGFTQLFATSANLAMLSKPGALEKKSLTENKAFPAKLPRTIKDSIKLTRMLGERYLWTDSLALLHDVGFKYHDDWVYARAALTVVAGSGKDADAGLLGVRDRTFHQDIEECTRGVRLMVSHLAEDYISTSQWDSRAWTFQERMLSRRCLIFVNGRIYYQCRRTTFCEDIDMPVVGWSLDSIDMPTRIFREKPFVQFTSAVELYTRRELTNPNDILNAFEGVQKVLEKRLNASVFYGAMMSEMDASLLWESSKRLVRRPLFPSWSWAGWMGEIQWKYTHRVYSWIEWPDNSQPDQDIPSPRVAKRLPPPIPKELILSPTVTENKKIEPWVLRFQTVSAVFQLSAPTSVHKDVISPLRKRLTGPSALSTVRPAPSDPELTRLIRAGISDRDGTWCGTIDLDEEVWKDRIGEPMEFIILSMVPHFTQDEKYAWESIVPDKVEDIMKRFEYGVYNVLLCSEKDGIHYREGLGRILTDALDKALDPGPVWKEVMLG